MKNTLFNLKKSSKNKYFKHYFMLKKKVKYKNIHFKS